MIKTQIPVISAVSRWAPRAPVVYKQLVCRGYGSVLGALDTFICLFGTSVLIHTVLWLYLLPTIPLTQLPCSSKYTVGTYLSQDFHLTFPPCETPLAPGVWLTHFLTAFGVSSQRVERPALTTCKKWLTLFPEIDHSPLLYGGLLLIIPLITPMTWAPRKQGAFLLCSLLHLQDLE